MALCSALLATTLVTLSVSRTAHLQCADTLMALFVLYVATVAACETRRRPLRSRCSAAVVVPTFVAWCATRRGGAYVATLVVEVVMIATFLASLVA